ncbi:Pre-mRNA cleavage complex II protein Clp1-domain-containing protein [Hyaloraphidium curvatum]|nr:Pre-mRNA cleavage complex II protein Clp1-domain-containing protein [Hyaloraphidium curvatum]
MSDPSLTELVDCGVGPIVLHGAPREAFEDFRNINSYLCSLISVFSLQLRSGNAEIFGTEIPVDRELEFSGRKLAVFTYHGCVLAVKGKPSVEYVADETPMSSYFNTHLALQQIREAAAGSEGPRVMVVGPSDVGKSTLARILLNYAVRNEQVPLFVDLDTNEGSVSVPGCLSATPITRVIDPEEDFSASAATTSLAPLVFYYGQTTPLDKPKLFSQQMTALADIVQKKLDVDAEVRTAGLIINTPSEFAEASGKDLLALAIKEFKVNVLLVIGNERLHSELSRKYKKGVSVVKLAKSGGVVSRDKNFRKQLQNRSVREYFYGTAKAELLPYSTSLPFVDTVIRRIGNAPSYLSLAMEREKYESRMIKVDPSDILLSFVLAVSSVDAPSTEKQGATAVDEDAESKLLIEGPVMGFVYISEVVTNQSRMNVLIPSPGRLPRKYMIMGTLTWRE